MCFLLAIFNVMSGITIMLMFLGDIFENKKDKPTPEQMSSALVLCMSLGAVISLKVMDVATRR